MLFIAHSRVRTHRTYSHSSLTFLCSIAILYCSTSRQAETLVSEHDLDVFGLCKNGDKLLSSLSISMRFVVVVKVKQAVSINDIISSYEDIDRESFVPLIFL